MKWMFKKKKYKTTKGTSSAVLLSIAIHAGLFLLAGALVVFTVVNEKEVEFEAPKAVERPKMKLKKPKVKVKKTSKPKQTTRIVTKMNRASMPDIQLPEVSGMGDGFDGALGGFEMMPEFEEETLLGGGQSIGNDFAGTFYDLKRDRHGQSNGMMEPGKFISEMTRFVESGWKPSKLAKYYRSSRKLYATTIAIPPVPATIGPESFGEPGSGATCFAVHYKGQLVYKNDITFRFWGMGDDMLIVRVDGKIVLNAPYPLWDDQYYTGKITPLWRTSSSKSLTHWLGVHVSTVGDWITLKAGEPLDMEVLIGEVCGGVFQAMLVVEVEGEEYERNPARGGPVLPIFKTAPPSIDLMEAIHGDLDPCDAMITNGPVFCDYEVESPTYYDPDDVDPPPPNLADGNKPEGSRTWTFEDGKTLEAEFMTIVAGKVVLKNKKGKQLKFPVGQFSPEDRRYVELENPPDFQINFSKTSELIPPQQRETYLAYTDMVRQYKYVFGTRLKQSTTKSYPHELRVELFAFGEEVDGDNYILLDRQQSTFIPSKENQGFHEFYSLKPVRIQTRAIRSAAPMRGTKYGGFLITITDERGKIIQYKTSHDWMIDILENLKDFPLGKHFNKKGIRVCPPRPGPGDRYERVDEIL